MYVLSWRTIYALIRVLFWCHLRNSGNEHQNNPLLSAWTGHISSPYLFLAYCIIWWPLPESKMVFFSVHIKHNVKYHAFKNRQRDSFTSCCRIFTRGLFQIYFYCLKYRIYVGWYYSSMGKVDYLWKLNACSIVPYGMLGCMIHCTVWYTTFYTFIYIYILKITDTVRYCGKSFLRSSQNIM